MAKKEGAIELEGTIVESLPNAMFRVELDNGQRHTIEGLSHPPTGKTRCTIARMTLNAADTLVIGLKRQA